MATIFDEIKNQLNIALEKLAEAEGKLKQWEDEKYKGKKLEEWEIKLIEENLNEAEQTKLERRMERLIKEKEELKATKVKWENQMINLQNKLADLGKGE